MDEPAVYKMRTHFSLPPLEVQRPALNTFLWMSLLFIKFALALAFPSGGRGTALAVDEVFSRLRTDKRLALADRAKNFHLKKI